MMVSIRVFTPGDVGGLVRPHDDERQHRPIRNVVRLRREVTGARNRGPFGPAWKQVWISFRMRSSMAFSETPAFRSASTLFNCGVRLTR